MTEQGRYGSTDDRNRERARTADPASVGFRLKPKVVVTESGPTVRFQLVYNGRASVDVGFQLSWKGELLDVQGPTLSLSPGMKPVDVSLSLPLDSTIGRGSKVTVRVVGSGGETYAVSSTGVVSVKLPSGKTYALSAKGLTLSVAAAGGIVIGAATYPWTDPDPADTADPTVAAQAVTTTTTEAETLLVPMLVPDELVATIDDTPEDPELAVDLFPFGRPDSLVVSFDERPGESSVSAVYDVAVTYRGEAHAIGAVELPAQVDPTSTDLLSFSTAVAAANVPLLDVGTGTAFVCFNPETLEVLGGNRTVSGAGDVVVGLTPLVGDASVSIVADVGYIVSSELVAAPNAELADIDSDRCPRTTSDDVVGWVSATPTFDGNEEEVAGADDGGRDGEGDADDSADDESSAVVEFSAEPETGSLSLGDEGERVTALQGALADAGLYGDEIDGRFGPATEAAVRRLQEIEGLTVDGLAGPATYEALGLPYPGSAVDGDDTAEQSESDYRPEPASGSLQLGHEGVRVAALQEALTAQGFFDGVIDGQFGPQTEDGVRAAQEAYGLDADGVAGPATHEALALDYP